MARLAAVAPTAEQKVNVDGGGAGLYAAGVKSVLLRKIRKAEQELIRPVGRSRRI